MMIEMLYIFIGPLRNCKTEYKNVPILDYDKILGKTSHCTISSPRFDSQRSMQLKTRHFTYICAWLKTMKSETKCRELL